MNIYGQCAGTGQLIANGANDDCAGIGGQNPKEWAGYGNCGAVTINGGMVTAMGGDHGAGIGGGLYGAGGTVTINGGEVTATGGEWGAGIGGGASGHADGTVTLGENVEIIEGAVGKSSRYVKIGKVVDVLKTEVETFDSGWYVVVPSNVYVNTHFKPDSNTRVEMKVKVQGTSEYWFGCWDGNWDDRAFALGNDVSTVYCGYGSGATCGGILGIIPTWRVTVALEKGVVYTNDAVWSAAHQSDATFALTNNLYLFAQNRNGTVGVGGSQESIICYGCKISTNGVNGAVVPVRNFVPARTKDEQQIVGLYDTVSGEFFAARRGSLTLGHDEEAAVLVTPGEPVVFDTAAEATNAMGRAELKLSDRVAAVFGEDADAKGDYCAKFGFEVVPTAGGEWAVEAVLKPNEWTKLVESAQAATRQIPIADIAAMTAAEKRDVKVVGCVPGFYYTLYDVWGLSALPTTETAYGPELCGLSGEVTFEKVAKPSDAAGFFSIGAKDR